MNLVNILAVTVCVGALLWFGYLLYTNANLDPITEEWIAENEPDPIIVVKQHDVAYSYYRAKALPTVVSKAMPASSWTEITRRGMNGMEDDGTVSLPTTGTYDITVTQANASNACSVGIQITPPTGTAKIIWNGSPSTGLTSSGLVSTLPIYAAAGTKVAPVYYWQGSASNSFVTGDQAIFAVYKKNYGVA